MLKAVNPELQDLTEEDLFREAAPALFGSSFEAEMKDRAESLKLISMAAKPPLDPKKFFQGVYPTWPQRGGGLTSREGGEGEATGDPRRSPPASSIPSIGHNVKACPH